MQLVDENDLFPSVCKNARYCPLTEERVIREYENQKPVLNWWHCPKWTDLEGELRADQLDLYLECATELGILPMHFNLAGSSDMKSRKVLKKVNEKGDNMTVD